MAEIKDKIVYALVSAAATEEEADAIICKYNPEFNPPISGVTIELYREKIKYTEKLFKIKHLAACSDPNATKIDELHDTYFAMLSILTLSEWS